MALKNFPIGIQDFASIRNEGFFYVDKTDLVYKLTHTSKYYFLSRPRRFGKSLLISTLQCYFEGRKELFTGLAMERLETEWKKYPVIRLDMSTVKSTDQDKFAENMSLNLESYEKEYCLDKTTSQAWGARLRRIIEAANNQTKSQVVVLVDEYDAPVLEAMGDASALERIRMQMRELYAPLKALGGMLRFVFLTGISKFSQLSIFSELNNLNVITMDDDYAAICGITKEELLTQMQPEIQALADKQKMTYDEAVATLQRRYDGYHFSENSPDIYNPFSLINSLGKQNFLNYWFASGTPTMLVKAMARYKLSPEEYDRGFSVAQRTFDAPTETAETPIPVLYQSGYLTIKGYEKDSVRPFKLQFPNDEVRNGMLDLLTNSYVSKNDEETSEFLDHFVTAMKACDIETALTEMRAFMASIPYDAEKQNEHHYRTIFYLIFRIATPYLVRCEERTAAGRADAVVETADAVYVFEFKLDANGTADDALRQIDDKGYLVPYTVTKTADGSPKKLFKIGVAFDAEKRTLGQWKIA
ncbi:ATP-binding protein [Fibrobacter sp. UWEL]|uniref:ATP-binding protein n=1 Tax=Fibrobacter sp. UWEL TaxID=1896209 RepID=UPI00091C86B2|nr:ATP-binding protein [Fibrobacter sp. UWEL]SHK71023.1 PD-(D/E)XK nuclease superfamily protein [Fibrobacter sp. UWEL]